MNRVWSIFNKFGIWPVLACLLGPVALSAATLTNLEIGQVGVSTFEATWTTSDTNAQSAIRIYRDEAMTQEITSGLEREWWPVPEASSVDLPGDFDERAEARRVVAAMQARGRVLVRVGGLMPAETVYVRALALDPDTASILGETGPVAVTTAARSAFLTEARQLVFSIAEASAGDSEGVLVRVSNEDSPYPLFGVLRTVGDIAQAHVQISSFLTADGTTQLQPGSQLNVTIEAPDLGIDPVGQGIPYDQSFQVTASTPVLIQGESPDVATFAFDPIGNHNMGIPFSVTIRALDSEGQPVSTFNESVVLSGSVPLASGGGVTPTFVGGVLENHSVSVETSGTHTLQASGAGVTGTSDPFVIRRIQILLSVDVSPPEGGSVSGLSGGYISGQQAVLEAIPAEGYSFVAWSGDFVDELADPTDPSLVLTLFESGSMTAEFAESGTTYEQYAQLYFGADATNEQIAGLMRDPEFDGVINLLEFAFGRHPRLADGDYRMPYVTKDANGDMSVHYFRRRGSTEIQYRILQNSGLPGARGDWEPYAANPSNVSVDPIDGDIERVTVRVPFSVGSFFRIEVTR